MRIPQVMAHVERADFPTHIKSKVVKNFHGQFISSNEIQQSKTNDSDFEIAYNNSSVSLHQSDASKARNISGNSEEEDIRACTACLTVSVVVFSIILCLCGFAFFAGGCIVQFGVTWLTLWTEDSILKPGAKDTVEALNIYLDTNDTDTNILHKMTNLIEGGLHNYTGGAMVSLLTIGILTAVFTLAGMLGICCKIRVLLIVYAIYLVCHILGELTVIIVYYVDTKNLAEKGRVTLERIIREDFVGILNSVWNIETVFLTVTQFWLGCCGIYSGEEYMNATKMTRNKKSSTYTGPDLTYPISCCNETAVTKCVTGNHASNSNHNVGCWSTLEEKITPIIMYAAIGTGIFVFIQLCTLILVIILLCYLRKMQKFYEQDDRMQQENTTTEFYVDDSLESSKDLSFDKKDKKDKNIHVDREKLKRRPGTSEAVNSSFVSSSAAFSTAGPVSSIGSSAMLPSLNSPLSSDIQTSNTKWNDRYEHRKMGRNRKLMLMTF